MSDWGPEDFQEKVRLRPRRVELPKDFSPVKLRPEDITDECLKQAYNRMAEIVTVHGDKYLPIFERLHAELEAREAKNSLMKTAQRIAEYNKN